MGANLSEWLNLVVRWVHVFAGILWVGQTYFFTWLDARFVAEEAARRDNPGEPVWMVHSGGFYAVEKRTVPVDPSRLRWFRWEAAVTWASGMVLLALVYYWGGALVDDTVADITVGTGVAVGLGVLVAAWIVYDLLWQSSLGRSETFAAAVCYFLVVAVAFGLTKVLSARAAYMHVGALFGTLMAANVWLRILPAQRRMVRAASSGEAPDAALAARAKLRSKHNTYMAVPVVFLMLSHHFPTATYGHRYAWLILALLVLAGAAAAKLLRRA